MSLYTKTGDSGTTSLYDTRRISKTNIIFDALGDLDELSAHIGIVCALCENTCNRDIVEQLRNIQRNLLDIGSDIATKTDIKREKLSLINKADIKEIETYIDIYDSNVPKLMEFILPGVYELDAQIHVCRAVCRRLERNMWKVKNMQDNSTDISTNINTFIYLNRLSDYFFALARVYSKGKEIKRSENKI